MGMLGPGNGCSVTFRVGKGDHLVWRGWRPAARSRVCRQLSSSVSRVAVGEGALWAGFVGFEEAWPAWSVLKRHVLLSTVLCTAGVGMCGAGSVTRGGAWGGGGAVVAQVGRAPGACAVGEREDDVFLAAAVVLMSSVAVGSVPAGVRVLGEWGGACVVGEVCEGPSLHRFVAAGQLSAGAAVQLSTSVMGEGGQGPAARWWGSGGAAVCGLALFRRRVAAGGGGSGAHCGAEVHHGRARDSAEVCSDKSRWGRRAIAE
jgi:hypothetical protein